MHDGVRQLLQFFLEQNAGFDLLNFDSHLPGMAESLDFGNLDSSETISTLKTLQRLLRVYPSTEIATRLMEAGFHSAHQISALSEQQFVQRSSKSLEGLSATNGKELARSIHCSATSIVECLRLQAMSLAILVSPASLASPASNSSVLLNFYSGLPSYKELFGGLNYVQCEECQSIWSPAAYFVDLLRLVETKITKPANEQLSLSARRPDLWQIPLTCESTNDEVPYLQIVNQILEAQVKARMKKVVIAGLQPAGVRPVLNFTGDTYIEIEQNPFLVPDYSTSPASYNPPTAFTICVWINPASLNPAGSMPIMGSYSSDGSNENLPSLYMPENTSNLVAFLQAKTEFTHTIENFFTGANEWVHVAWVFESTEQTQQSTIYRNGIEVGTVSPGTISVVSGTKESYYIGNSDSKSWNGMIANVGIWLRALAPNEIREVMKAEGLPESRSDMASYWLIDDGTTTNNTIANSAPYAIVNSTLGGTLQSSGTWTDLSVSTASSFLSANPVFSQQPLLYLATQDYPFKLPFNHPLVQIRRLLDHFGFTLADLYAAFHVGKAKGDHPAGIAREMLELSPEKYRLLTRAIDSFELPQAYGLIDGENPADLSDAQTFLNQTGLDDTQLNELFYQNLRRKRVLEFDGSLEVFIGNPPALQALTGDLTIELWVRPNQSANQTLLDKSWCGEFSVVISGAPTNYYYGELGAAPKSDEDGFQKLTGPNLTPHEWSHLAIVRDLSSSTPTLTFYVNGSSTSASATYAAAVAGIWPVLIGNGWSGAFTGQIADVRLWKTARTEDQINAAMNQRLIGNEAGLSGCWPLDDGFGTTVHDISSSENNGTVGGLPAASTDPPMPLIDAAAWPFASELAWDSNEINGQILSQFFINQGLQANLPASQYQYLAIQNCQTNGKPTQTIVVANPVAGTATALNDPGTLDRLNRFIRLAQSLEWSFADLDLALRSITAPPHTAIDETAIKALAAIKKLQSKLGLKVDEVCALWSDMNTFGIGNDPEPADLFDRTLNYPQSFTNTTGVPGTPPYRPLYSSNPLYTDTPLTWSPADRIHDDAVSTRSSLRAALRLADADLTRIAEEIVQNDGTISLTVPNLSKFYRYATLAHALDLPVSELLTLLRLVSIDDQQPIESLLDIVAWAEWMKATGLNTAQLEYLTTGKTNPWIDRGYDPDAVAGMLSSMFQDAQPVLLTPNSFMTTGISQQQAEQIFQTLETDGALDANGRVLKQPVEQALGPEPLSRSVLNFDGSSTYISIPNDPFIGADKNPFKQFTICVWVNPKVTNPTIDFTVCGGRDNGELYQTKPTMYLDSGTPNELVLTLGGSDGTNNQEIFTQKLSFFPEPGAWVHIAWVFEVSGDTAGTSSVYRNGKLIDSQTVSNIGEIYTSTSTGFALGLLAGVGSGHWSGEISNFGVWERTLDEDEIISAMYATDVPKDNIGLTAYWEIDDQSITIKDSVGDNSGTTHGPTNWVSSRDLLGGSNSSNLIDLLVRERLTAALAQQDVFVTQKLAAFFKTSPATMFGVQAVATATIDQPLGHINRLLIDLPPGDSLPDHVNQLFAALARDLYLANALKLPAPVMAQIAFQPTAFSISDLPKPGVSFNWTLKNLRALTIYQKLLASFRTTPEAFAAYFRRAVKTAPGFAAAAQSKLADITDWPVDQIALLEGQDFWSDQQFDTVEQVAGLKECFDLAERLGCGIDFLLTLRRLHSFHLGRPGHQPRIDVWEAYQIIAHDLSQTIGAKYGNSIAPQVMSQIEGKLEEFKRDVFAAFLLWELSFTYKDIKTTDDLYDFLLIDVDMSSVVQISLLKAGLNSLQLYVETTQMNLESEVVNEIPRLWWKWMSNYRVWQANREVFLYPENYIDPGLRRFPTPEFKQLQSNLQQGSLTPELVEKALAGYLEGLANIANLEIVASYRAAVSVRAAASQDDQTIDTLFVFGRTRTNPATFYYRTLRMFGGAKDSVWTPWQQINLTINARMITPVYVFEKLFIFWVEQTSKTVNITPDSTTSTTSSSSSSSVKQDSYQVTTATIYFSFQKLDRTWTQPQILEQNCPIVVTPAPVTTKNPTINPKEPEWNRVRTFVNQAADQLLVLLGELTPAAPPAAAKPQEPTGNHEIDAYDDMIYESLAFANSISASGFQTSYVPLWTIGETLGRDRAKLKINPTATNFCSGILINDQLEYSAFLFPLLVATHDALTAAPEAFLPLSGSFTGKVDGQKATATAGPEWVTDESNPLGPGNPVLGFDNAAQNVSASFNAMTGSVSAEVWVKFTSDPGQNSYGSILTITDPASTKPNVGYQVFYSGEYMYIGNTGLLQAYLPIPTVNEWVCLTFVVDADSKNATLYLNGIQAVQTTDMTISSVDTVILGNNGEMNCFAGNVTHVAIWNRVLNSKEVMLRYQNPVSSAPLLTAGLSPLASQTTETGNQPGWFTFDNGDEAFLVVPMVPGENNAPDDYDIFKSFAQLATVSGPAPDTISQQTYQRVVTVTFGNAAANPAIYNFNDLKLEYVRLTTHTVAELQRRFLIGGPDMLLDLISQSAPEILFGRFKPTSTAIPPAKKMLDFDGAFGEYFWELFFYTPFLMANTFSANQRFQLAQQWFQYLFDPTPRPQAWLHPLPTELSGSGLISNWPLEGNAEDTMGINSGLLEILKEPAFVSTRFADGRLRSVFNSSGTENNSIQVPITASLQVTNAITLAGWYNFSSFGSSADEALLIACPVADDVAPYYVYRLAALPGTGFFFSLGLDGNDTVVYSNTNTPILNQWYYVVGTYDGQNMYLYVNGEQQTSHNSTTAKIDTSDQNVVLSTYGMLADVRIWDRALSAQEISNYYQTVTHLQSHVTTQNRFWRFRPFLADQSDSIKANLNNQQQIAVYEYDPFDPDALARLRIGANERGILMRYVENLIKWGNKLFSQYTWETITEASMLYTAALDLLGPMPRQDGEIVAPPVKTAFDFVTEYGGAKNIPQFLIELENVTFTPPTGKQLPALPFNLLNSYFCVPMNEALLALWKAADSQLYKIRHGENIKGQPQPLPLFEPPVSPAAMVRAGSSSGAAAQASTSGSATTPYYRFSYLIAQAKDLTSQVIQLGSNLLGALERQDAEQLALMQNTDEGVILNLTTQIKQSQIDGLEQTAQSLQAALAGAQDRQQTYQSWLHTASGDDSWTDTLTLTENLSLGLLAVATEFHGGAALMRAIASPICLLPNIFGLADGGMNFGGSVEAVAGALDSTGATLGSTSQLLGMVAQFQRREQEWLLQYQLASDDVAQIRAQIAANQSSLAAAQQDLEINQEQITQNQTIGNFYKTKFTNEQLYQWMAGRLSTLYYQSYQLAFALAQEAQMAFQFEQNSQKNYLNYSAWDSLEQGLTAGDSLMFSLNQLEKANIDAGVRHLEIDKTISLLQIDPQAVLDLKQTGKCSFALTEQLFDYDFPGQYNRKIASVSITIPAIVGPYQNIHAILTQTSNRVVLQPDKAAVNYLMPGGDQNGGPPLTIRSNWNINQQVALSRGASDSGLFELNFNDPRYLPFEGTGAISSWTLEMPRAANPIDFNSISDVIIQLRYTAQDGGLSFYKDVSPLVQTFSAVRFLSLRQTFPEAWHNFLNPVSGQPSLKFPILRAMFPVNLMPASVTLGAPASTSKTPPPGTIGIQMLWAECAKPSLSLTKLNNAPISNNQVVLTVPSIQGDNSEPVELSSFGPSVTNELETAGSVPVNKAAITDVVLIIPFSGKLNWPTSKA